MRVYCQVGKASQAKFALDVAVKTLDLYKEYVLCCLIVLLPVFSTKASDWLIITLFIAFFITNVIRSISYKFW